MPDQIEKGELFRSLHTRDTAFIIPNPWDLGSARLLEHLGFEALATTSAGFAFSLGKRDNTVGRNEILRHVASMCQGTRLPVSADLENGFGDTPEAVSETLKLAAAAGLVGGSIEDATGRSDDPIYDLALAVERIRAAAEFTRALPFKFTLTARAENFLVGRPDLSDTIKRLQAYERAGADVLYAPGLKTKDDIAAVVRSVSLPVNVLMGTPGLALYLSALSELGVKRVSVGSALCRAAFGALVRAAHEMREQGTFNFAEDAIGFGDITAIL